MACWMAAGPHSLMQGLGGRGKGCGVVGVVGWEGRSCSPAGAGACPVCPHCLVSSVQTRPCWEGRLMPACHCCFLPAACLGAWKWGEPKLQGRMVLGKCLAVSQIGFGFKGDKLVSVILWGWGRLLGCAAGRRRVVWGGRHHPCPLPAPTSPSQNSQKLCPPPVQKPVQSQILNHQR